METSITVCASNCVCTIEILDPCPVVILLMDETTRASFSQFIAVNEKQVGYYGNTIFLGVNNSRELYNHGITA